MTTLVITFLVLVTIVTAMSVGVIFGRKPIKGSCGGMQGLGLKENCEICGGDEDKCENEKLKNSKAGNASFYSADKE